MGARQGYQGRMVLAAAVLGLLAELATALEVEIREWRVPREGSRPRDPWVDGAGAVWFVGQKGDYVARFEPDTARFEHFPLPPGAGPHNLVEANGAIWYAGSGGDHVGRLDPATGVVEILVVPAKGHQDVHTLMPGPGGQLWFTARRANRIGRLDMATRGFSLWVPEGGDAGPCGLVVDAAGAAWVALSGRNGLARVDPVSGRIREVELPRKEARPRRLAVGPDGRIWYLDYVNGRLGSYDPVTGMISEWRTPGGIRSGPGGMAADGAGRIWFVETGLRPNRLVAFDPGTERFVARAEIPGGGILVRHMVYDPARDSLWFGTDADTLAQARILDRQP